MTLNLDLAREDVEQQILDQRKKILFDSYHSTIHSIFLRQPSNASGLVLDEDDDSLPLTLEPEFL